MSIRGGISELTELLCFAVYAWTAKEISDDEFSLYDNYVSDQILSVLKTEIEKMENPYTESPGTGVAHKMYEEFREDILKLLEEK